MNVLRVRNVHEALPVALAHLKLHGVERDSRNGKVLMVDGPVATVYDRPTERVMFHDWRDANPFFHFYESLWMLAGRRDVEPLVRYVKTMADFSDDGVLYNAAYGARWRQARGPAVSAHVSLAIDQLPPICDILRRDKNSRQAVLQIWDHEHDLSKPTKDRACNVSATFQVGLDGKLDMVVFCRSNDIVWGCYGANAVHYSMLHEYVAGRSGYPVGTYTQISVNWHGYLRTAGPLLEFAAASPNDSICASPYEFEPIYEYPLVVTPDSATVWDATVRDFVRTDGRCPSGLPTNAPRFFQEVAWPIVRAHDAYKDLPDGVKYERARAELASCEAQDWRMACEQWLDRREAKQK